MATRCVVGVPVYFDAAQRAATRRAAKIAGFTDVALMAESTAAAVAWVIVGVLSVELL